METIKLGYLLAHERGNFDRNLLELLPKQMWTTNDQVPHHGKSLLTQMACSSEVSISVLDFRENENMEVTLWWRDMA